MAKRYWLVKSEPDVFSIDDLENAEKQTTMWEGVRNYQARNLMRDEMKKGDLVIFYHSNAKPPGAAGTATVTREAYPDPYQFDARSKYFDPASKEDDPRWFLVDVTFRSKFARLVSLDEIKAHPALGDMVLVKRSRLSVQPVEPEAFRIIERLGGTRK
jgi:predicted RNA-binding protein with PUA-like domain